MTDTGVWAGREARALQVSLIAGVGIATLGVVWGVLSGSRAVLFDGVFSLVGILMSLMSVLAGRGVQRGVSPAFPYGRESFVPLTIGVQGMTRLGIAVFAIVDAAATIRSGGDPVETGSVIGYAAITLAICLTISLSLPRIAPASDLVSLETVGWRVGTLLTGAMLIGFAAVALLPAGHLKDTASLYVDPVLVIVTSLLVLPVPVRLLRTTLRELLEMVPPPEIAEPATQAVNDVCAAYALTNPTTRLTKTGGKLYVEVNHVVPAGTWDVSDIDRLRDDLRTALTSDRYDIWLNVDLTCTTPGNLPTN